MERDTSSDRSGDRAVWRDLVARLELPHAIDPADAPWPDRENLTPGRPAAAPGRPGQRDPGPDGPAPGHDDSQDVPVTRRRVIKRATFMRFAEASQAGETEPGGPGQAAGGNDLGAVRDGIGRGLDFQDLADLEFYEDERFVPPETAPQPKLDPVAKGAWAALFGGPGYLFLATTLSWHVPGWAELAAIIAFVAGFIVLVSRLGDGPSRKDGPDQGAVV